jgi:hypothetical protein
VRLYEHTEEEISRYSWQDFLDHTVYLTNQQGSALYDATLGDAELIEQMYEEELERISSKLISKAEREKEVRPPRRGYTRTVEAIYDLVDNMVALRGELGRWSPSTTERQMSKRPWFPGEVVADRVRNRNRSIRDMKIRQSQNSWAQRNGR